MVLGDIYSFIIGNDSTEFIPYKMTIYLSAKNVVSRLSGHFTSKCLYFWVNVFASANFVLYKAIASIVIGIIGIRQIATKS
jgi:hypothetical protein